MCHCEISVSCESSRLALTRSPAQVVVDGLRDTPSLALLPINIMANTKCTSYIIIIPTAPCLPAFPKCIHWKPLKENLYPCSTSDQSPETKPIPNPPKHTPNITPRLRLSTNIRNRIQNPRDQVSCSESHNLIHWAFTKQEKYHGCCIQREILDAVGLGTVPASCAVDSFGLKC